LYFKESEETEETEESEEPLLRVSAATSGKADFLLYWSDGPEPLEAGD
jgi:hypothetical protein